MEERYLIADRFLVEWGWTGRWFVKDWNVELYEIFRIDPIQVEHIHAYKGDNVYWILEDILLASPKELFGYAVIKGDKIVSYSRLERDKIYIKHYGEGFLGKIKVGEENKISINGKYFEVRKGEKDPMEFKYIFLGEKLTPMIGIRGERGKVVCFPEFSKVYSGKIYVEQCWGCVNIWVFENETVYFYVLFGNGEEYLVYEGTKTSLKNSQGNNFPTLYRIGDVIVVYFYGEENGIVCDLEQIPSFRYLYVKRDLDKNVYISFNPKSWKKIEQAEKLIFKRGKIGIGIYTLHFQSYTSISALENLAKKI